MIKLYPGPALTVLCFFLTNLVIGQPVITSFWPLKGNAGSTVTITGSGFNPTAGANTVYFGGVKATVNSATSTSLVITVPVSAGYQTISVTNSGLTGVSKSAFDETFANTATLDSSFFATHVDSTTGNSPYRVRHADIDGDGKPDIIVVDGGANTLAIYRNTSVSGSISFAAPIYLSTGPVPYDAIATDVDGDGKLDLVVSGSQSYDIYIYPNTSTPGTISFGTTSHIFIGNPTNLVLGDLDGDGRPDVVATSLDGKSISVYRNTSSPGSVSFGAGRAYTTGNSPLEPEMADIDGDGKLDVLVPNSADGTVSIFLNTSSGPGTITLATQALISVPGGPSGIVVTDLDGDGVYEVAVANGNMISVFRDNSTPGSISFGTRQDFPTVSAASSVKAADIDGDGKPDLEVSGSLYDSIGVLRNTSVAGTVSFATGVNFKTGQSPYNVTVTDLDGDGRPDMVSADEASSQFSILRNIGLEPSISTFSPLFGGPGMMDTITGLNLTGLTAVSFGGTPALSFSAISPTTVVAIVGAGASGNVTVTNSMGSASHGGYTFYPAPVISSFTPTTAVPGGTVTITGSNFSGAMAVSFGGVEADTFVVVNSTTITAVIGVGATGNVQVSTAGGTDTLTGFVFGVPVITSVSPLSGPPGTVVTISGAAFNTTASNNIVFFGAVRAVVNSATANKLTVTVPIGAAYAPVTVTANGFTASSNLPFVLAFPGGGTLTDSTFNTASTYPVGMGPSGMKICDIDGDGKPDLAVTYNDYQGYEPNGTALFRNTSVPGSVSFASTINVATSTYASFPGQPTFIDLDGDGKPEMLITNNGSDDILVYQNTSTIGNISLAPAMALSCGSGSVPTGIAVGDLNGDGKPDIVVADNGYTAFSIFINTTVDHVLSFAPGVYVNTPTNPSGVCLGDLDGDGRLDVFTGLGSTVCVLRNTTQGGVLNFASPMQIAFGNGLTSYAVEPGDMDQDGKLDLVAFLSPGNTLGVLKNISTPGTIAFNAPVQASLGFLPGAGFCISDVDGDGRPDIASAAGNTTAILLNTTSGGAISFGSANFYNKAGGARMTMGDIDGDGRPDIATGFEAASGTSSSVNVLLNSMAPLPPPEVDSIAPDTAITGTTVTITGSHFTEATRVTFGGVSASTFTVLSDTVITAVVGAGATGAVNVTTPGGSDSISGFVYKSTLISSFTPDSAKSGGVVTVKGSYFSGTTTVSFGGVAASSFTVVSDSVITAVVGSGATGSVSVTAPDGQAKLGGFIFIDTTSTPPSTPPSAGPTNLSSFSPTSGTKGTVLTIHGHDLTGATMVSFGGVPATSFTVISDSVINATVDTGATGEVYVNGPNGADSLAGFSYIDTASSTPPPVTTPPADTSFQLTQFNAAFYNGQVVLQWQAKYDNTVSYYLIDRSSDSAQFTLLSTVAPKGADSIPLQYSFTDPQPLAGTSFYRLRVFDQVGVLLQTSDTVTVHLGGAASTLVIHPNPARDYFTVLIPDVSSPSYLQVVDMAGRIVGVMQIAANVQQVNITAASMENGMYKVIWSNGINHSFQTVLVLH